MRVIHIITSLHPDGAQQMLRRLVFGTSDRIEHIIVSLAPRVGLSQVFEDAGIRVVHLNLKKVANPFAIAKEVAALIESSKPQLIQSWLYHSNLAAALAVKKLTNPPPLLWGIRSAFAGFTIKAARTSLIVLGSRWLASIPQKIIVNSLSSLEQHVKIGYPRNAMVYLPNGFDTERFKPDQLRRAAVRKELGFNGEDIVVEICGRNDFTKDYPTFIRAFAIASAAVPKMKAVLIGRDIENSPEILTEITRHGLGDKVAIVGFAEQTQDYFVSADIGCSSSISEGFPNVVAEAMLCGLPMAVTDVGMSAQLVDTHGLVVPPNDPESLGEALATLAGMKSDERELLGRKSRERIEGSYSLKAVLGQFVDLYFSTVEERNGKASTRI